MPHGARTSLAALILLLGVGGVTAEPAAGSTWTDPPARKPAEAAAPEQKVAPAPAPSSAQSPIPSSAKPPVASTPAAVAEEVRPARTTRKATARRAPTRIAARRAAPKRRVAAAHTPRIAAAPPRAFAGPRIAAAPPPPPPPPPQGYARYRPYGYGPGYDPGYADGRLDRLSSAEAAGYVVVRRRTVVFPDGRTLRVYRPDDREPF